MGYDDLSIMSMNSSRPGLLSMTAGQRKPYLEKVLDGCHPDVCFFPGDDQELKNCVVVNYSQYLASERNKSVLIYNPERTKMSQHNVNWSTFGPIPGIDFDKISCPLTEVMAKKPAPSGTVVKKLTVLSWEHDMFSASGLNDPARFLEGILVFAQRLTQSTNVPILIGGEISVQYEMLKSIVNNRNQLSQHEFMSDIKPTMPQEFLPSMTSGSTREFRQKFKMDVFRCKSDNRSVSGAPDCFIASKELELTEPTLVDLDQVSARKVGLKATGPVKYGPAVKDYCPQTRPVQTSVSILPRPPKHHGG